MDLGVLTDKLQWRHTSVEKARQSGRQRRYCHLCNKKGAIDIAAHVCREFPEGNIKSGDSDYIGI